MDMVKIIAMTLDLKPKRAIGVFLLEQWELLDSLQNDPRFHGFRLGDDLAKKNRHRAQAMVNPNPIEVKS